MSTDHSNSLEEQVGELRSRVCRLEEALGRQGILSPEFLHQPTAEQHLGIPPASAPPLTWTAEIARWRGGAGAPPVQGVAPQEANTAPPIATPSFGYSAPAAAEDDHSLENRIGSQWFNRTGILAMLIGMAWFLKLAMDNHWIGPLGRVLIGLVAGAALIAWSERFRRSGYAIFSYSLKAVGSGTLYLSLWAAFSLYQLIPPGVAFAAMILVTAFNGYMAWVQDAELLGLYAIAGALSTPILVSTGENHEVTLFSYLLLLNIAVLVLVALRPWSRLLFGAFVGRRIEKISPSFTSIFVYDADNLLETLNASGSEVASYTVCFRQACGTLVQKRVVIQDSRTMSANSGCTSEEGNPCHLRRHSRSHG